MVSLDKPVTAGCTTKRRFNRLTGAAAVCQGGRPA